MCIYYVCVHISMYTDISIYVHTYGNNERCNVDVDRLSLFPAPSVVWVFPYFLIVFLIGFSFEIRQFIKTIRICFFIKCWQCLIWPGLFCQVQLWSMIENNICAWHFYFYSILHVHSACLWMLIVRMLRCRETQRLG